MTPASYKAIVLMTVIAAACVASAAADTHYVWPESPSPTSPYADWHTAAHTIQAAVDRADAGDRVLVTNGVYQSGSRVTPGYVLENRVVITNDIVVQSVHGPKVTVIEGAADLRGVYMSAGLLSGFTVTKGDTFGFSGNYNYDRTGGGVCMYGGTGVVSNCVITANTAYEGGGTSHGVVTHCTISSNTAANAGGGTRYGMVTHSTINGNCADANSGGGTYNSMVSHCTISNNDAGGYGGGVYYAMVTDSTISGNHAGNGGGGAYYAVANNCTMTGNSADTGGGTLFGAATNCTIVGNHAANGGGAYRTTLQNCIVFDNQAADNRNAHVTEHEAVSYTCTTPNPGGPGNITADPRLTVNGRLKRTSPCIDAGTDAGVPTTDSEGEARWDSPYHANSPSIVDMGADEYLDRDDDWIPDYWETQYGLNPSTNDAAGDADGDQSSNYEEYLADTDPLDRDSALRIVSIGSAGTDVQVEWQRGQWSCQYLETSTNPATGSWTPLVTNGPATPFTRHVFTPPSGGVATFFRVRAHR